VKADFEEQRPAPIDLMIEERVKDRLSKHSAS